MLCCHILKVMVKNDISKILEKYIIDRWQKKEQKMYYNKPIDLPIEATALKFNDLALMSAEMRRRFKIRRKILLPEQGDRENHKGT